MMKKKDKKVVNIPLCGGGYYGYAEVAALKEMDNYKEYFDIKHISGVSVGSMVAALYAVGYNPDELAKVMFNFDFDKLIKDSMFPYLKLYEKYGMYEACPLEEEIEKFIRIKTNIKYCTFSQIKMKLSIFSTNLNMQCPRLFNKDTTPEIPISKAVRMSISYPLVMTPILFEGDYFGDGGIYMNYPILMFEKQLDETIGITFAAYNENNDGTLKTRVPINDVYDYIRSMGVTMSRAAYVSQIGPKFLERSIVVKIDQNISSMQFNLTMEQKKYIYECGAKAMREQLPKILGITDHILLEEKVTPPDPAKCAVPDNLDMVNAVKYLVSTNPQIANNISLKK